MTAEKCMRLQEVAIVGLLPFLLLLINQVAGLHFLKTSFIRCLFMALAVMVFLSAASKYLHFIVSIKSRVL